MFCRKCGKEIGESLYCPFCGEYNGEGEDKNKSESTNQEVVSKTFESANETDRKSYNPNQGVLVAAKVFIVLGIISQGWAIIPLLWCLPIGICSWKKINNATSSKDLVGLGVATLILVSLVGGILMLCARDDD